MADTIESDLTIYARKIYSEFDEKYCNIPLDEYSSDEMKRDAVEAFDKVYKFYKERKHVKDDQC